MVPANNQSDFDRDSHDPLSSAMSAAGIVRQLAAQLERANYQARDARGALSAEEQAQRLDFALVHLASVLSETELISLVGALRHTADAAQEDPVCEFCGAPTQPWSMLTSATCDEEDCPDALIEHSWDQYGVTLCKSCHLSVRNARWQVSSQM